MLGKYLKLLLGILQALNIDKISAQSLQDIPDADLLTPQIIKKYGYPSETHVVQTLDGYFLTIHRIPRGRDVSSSYYKRPAVLVQHGVLCSSVDWIILGPGRALGYVLADNGYDVWLPNLRGNTYSKNHTRMNPRDKNFWQFSFHEMGIYDLPAIVDYILEVTGQEQLFYVGHSMGTTVFYVMASSLPHYNAKIKAMISLAPIAYLDHIKTPLAVIMPYASEIGWGLSLLGINEILPNNRFMKAIGRPFCTESPESQVLCGNILFLLCGFDPQELNITMIPTFLKHTPAGTSVNTLVHYSQVVNSKKFRKYDYSFFGNLKHYSSFEPPEYDLGKITAPVALHYSDNDWLAAPQDVERLYAKLPNPIGKFKVPLPKFNHLDFVWAIDVKDLLYDDVIRLMAQYQ